MAVQANISLFNIGNIMVAFNKFNDFAEQLGLGTHQLQAAGHTLKVYASNATPSASLDTVKVDLAEITAENGYPSGGTDIANDWSETGGTATLVGTDVVWTASGGTFGPLRYIVLYNDTPTSPADPLIGWWDYGSSVTPSAPETFTVDFGASVLTLA